MRALRGFIAGLLLCAFAVAADGDLQPIPTLTARVTDLTGTLDEVQKQTLERDLAALEQRKGAQLGVLVVSTTQPEDIAPYATRVFDAWKLGRKNIDDGALLIVAKGDRRVRIEVARGLEGAIPDAAAARIIREYVTPKFRANDYYGGIQDAVGALTQLIDGESLPPPLTEEHPRRDPGDLFNGAIFAIVAGLWMRTLLSRATAPPRAAVVGLVTGGIGWLISGLLPLGLGLGVVGLVLGLFSGGGGGGFASGGGTGGWGGGFGGGGSFGGGGGFSGGGGISAGGGASGSW